MKRIKKWPEIAGIWPVSGRNLLEGGERGGWVSGAESQQYYIHNRDRGLWAPLTWPPRGYAPKY